MDEIDLKLLRLLQKNARTPIKALAGEVSLSSPAVSARSHVGAALSVISKCASMT